MLGGVVTKQRGLMPWFFNNYGELDFFRSAIYYSKMSVM